MKLARLREIRQDRALSLRALSDSSGVSPTTILRAEQGGETYSTTVRKLAKALDCTPAELRGDEPPAGSGRLRVARVTSPQVWHYLQWAAQARAAGDEAKAADWERAADRALLEAD